MSSVPFLYDFYMNPATYTLLYIVTGRKYVSYFMGVCSKVATRKS